MKIFPWLHTLVGTSENLPHGANELGTDEEDIYVTHDFVDPIAPTVSEWIDRRVGQGTCQKVKGQVHVALSTSNK